MLIRTDCPVPLQSTLRPSKRSKIVSYTTILSWKKWYPGDQRTRFKSHITWPPIPWSVNSFLQYISSTFGYVHLKWYILYSLKGQRRFMSWALKNKWLILRPYNSRFLLTTTSFIPSWIMMNETGVSSHKGRYSGHFLANISRDN